MMVARTCRRGMRYYVQWKTLILITITASLLLLIFGGKREEMNGLVGGHVPKRNLQTSVDTIEDRAFIENRLKIQKEVRTDPVTELPKMDYKEFAVDVPFLSKLYNMSEEDLLLNEHVYLPRRYHTGINATLLADSEEIYFQDPVYPERHINLLRNNELICGDRPIDLLIYVHARAKDFDKRKVIRDSWGNITRFRKINIVLVFFIGKSDADENKLKEEYARYHDVIKGDFMDSYRNLTLKVTVALGWIKDYCPQARYILKTDDDVFLNIFAMLKFILIEHHGDQRYIGCFAKMKAPVERRRSIWNVAAKDLVGAKKYPIHCIGPAILMTSDVAADMYKASQVHPFFWVDDVYMSGFLPRLIPYQVKYIPFGMRLDTVENRASKYIYSSRHTNFLVYSGNKPKDGYWKWVLNATDYYASYGIK